MLKSILFNQMESARQNAVPESGLANRQPPTAPEGQLWRSATKFRPQPFRYDTCFLFSATYKHRSGIAESATSLEQIFFYIENVIGKISATSTIQGG